MSDHTVEATDGTPLSVTSEGSGPPVLLLHGLACTRVIWTDVSRALVDTHRVITVDLRGHGASVPVAGGFSLAQQADDVASLLTILDLRDVVIVGHSAGGYAALAFASLHAAVAAERVRAIVTLGTSPSLDGRRERAVLWFSATQVFYALFAIAPVGRVLVRAGAFGTRPKKDALEATRRMALELSRATKSAWIRAISGTSVGATDEVPVLMVTGERDTTVTPRRLRLIAARTGARAEVLAGAGHMSPLEAPAEIARIIERNA